MPAEEIYLTDRAAESERMASVSETAPGRAAHEELARAYRARLADASPMVDEVG